MNFGSLFYAGQHANEKKMTQFACWAEVALRAVCEGGCGQPGLLARPRLR